MFNNRYVTAGGLPISMDCRMGTVERMTDKVGLRRETPEPAVKAMGKIEKQNAIIKSRMNGESIPQEVPRETLPVAKQMKMIAKELKIRCYNWMKKEDLEMAVKYAREGKKEELSKLESLARERSKIAWEAWRKKKEMIKI